MRIIIKEQDKISSKQKAINKGQREINGALCYVDWHVIKALYNLVNVMAEKLPQLDLTQVRKELRKAYYASERVADIDPPGCGDDFEQPPEEPAEPSIPTDTAKPADASKPAETEKTDLKEAA
jgi:hypothetical protein